MVLVRNISPLFISETLFMIIRDIFMMSHHWWHIQNIFDNPFASLSSFFFVNSRILFEMILIFFNWLSLGSSTKSKSNFADSNSLILENESARRMKTLFLFFKMSGKDDSKSRAQLDEYIVLSYLFLMKWTALFLVFRLK